MCFTININTSRDAIEKRFNVNTSLLHDYEYRYFYRAFDNPFIPVITQEKPDEVQLFQWGLIPHWAKDVETAEMIRRGTYNARSETIHKKASFRESFKRKRCWVISRGFYEWQHTSKEKIPWYIQSANSAIFAFAGIYDNWQNPETGENVNSFSIVTTKANQLMEKIHNAKKRMPLILFDHNENRWIEQKGDLLNGDEIMLPYENDKLSAYTIGKNISSTSSDPTDPSILDHVEYHIDGKLF